MFNHLKSHFFFLVGGGQVGWGWEENTIILGGGRIVTKCSVQKSFVIKIVYTVKSECLFFTF